MSTEEQKDMQMVIKVELPTTSDIFKKHFNDYGCAGLFHPNAEAFFTDLNNVCLIEDALNEINSHPVNR